MFRSSQASRDWQEAFMEGFAVGFAIGFEKGYKETQLILRQKLVRSCLDENMPVKKIAELLDIPTKEAHRLAKDAAS